MSNLLSRFYADETGEVAISYSLIATLISIAAIIAMTQLGDTLPQIYNFVNESILGGLSRMGLL